MIGLPSALAPWAAELELFPPDVAEVLGAMASSVSRVIGETGLHRASIGEPDGIGGITRRGSYERLLASEWLLREEIPEEFLRRVVASEQLFLERSHRADSKGRRSVVLFDAGPFQLGAPRLVQLATLVVLARRARRLSASFAFGVLQDERATLYDALTSVTVRLWIGARSTRVPSRADLSRWDAATRTMPPCERWIVGSPRFVGDCDWSDVSSVAVSEEWEPDAPRRVRASVVATKGALPRVVTLAMPDERLAIRALRDPLEPTAAAPKTARIDPRSNLVFGSDGRRLYVRAEDGGVVTFRLPNSPNAPAVEPAAFVPPPGERVVAIGFWAAQRRGMVVTQSQSEMWMHMVGKRSRGGVGDGVRFDLPPDFVVAEPVAEIAELGILGAWHACFVDARGRLIELAEGRARPHPITAMTNATATPNGLAFVDTRGEERTVWSATEESPSSMKLVGWPHLDGRSCTASRAILESNHAGSWVAFAESPGEWALRGAKEAHRFQLSIGDDVVASWGATSRLVAVDATRRRVMSISTHGARTVIETADPIVSAGASWWGYHVAATTTTGLLVVYSGTRDCVVLRVTAR